MVKSFGCWLRCRIIVVSVFNLTSYRNSLPIPKPMKTIFGQHICITVHTIFKSILLTSANQRCDFPGHDRCTLRPYPLEGSLLIGLYQGIRSDSSECCSPSKTASSKAQNQFKYNGTQTRNGSKMGIQAVFARKSAFVYGI